MPTDGTIPINPLAYAITQAKSQIFREHPRAVSFRFDSKWYQGIRVATLTEDLEMMQHAFNPDVNTVLKVNFLSFTNADGSVATTPDVNDRIRMDNIDWRVEERIVEADDFKLILRKEVEPV